jgi:hypothetical protein
LKPYTYLIRWTQLNISYYGVRYAQDCDPSDLWNPYKTSSDKVKEFLALNSEPDIIQVRKTFTDPMVARLWENRVLTRLKVSGNPKWLNTNHTMAPPVHSGETHHNKRPEARARQRARMLANNPMNNPESRAKITGDKNGGKKPESREKQRQNQLALGDKHHTKRPEERERRRQRILGDKHHFKKSENKIKITGENNHFYGKKHKRTVCEHCNKDVAVPGYIQHHGDKCKMNLARLVANTDLDVYNH